MVARYEMFVLTKNFCQAWVEMGRPDTLICQDMHEIYSIRPLNVFLQVLAHLCMNVHVITLCVVLILSWKQCCFLMASSKHLEWYTSSSSSSSGGV